EGKSWQVAAVPEGPAFAMAPEPGSASLLTADLDNNGGRDLVAATPKGTRIWLSDEEGKFQLRPALPPRVAQAVDLTRDGRLDLLALSDAGQPVRLTNRGAKPYHWQLIRPFANRKEGAKADERIN